MRAEIISIGSELLRGEIADTNAPYLAQELLKLGYEVGRITLVGDDQESIVEVLRQAWERSDLVLTVGGLGPTQDDLTREAVAKFFGERLEIDPSLERWLRETFQRLGRRMPEENLKQATLISSARSVPNPKGTAPGWWVEREGKRLIALPGPPRELERMWREKIASQLHGPAQEVVLCHTLKIWSLSESEVDEELSALPAVANLQIGTYAKFDGIHVQLVARAERREEAERLLAETTARIRSLFGERIWGQNEERLEALVGELLRKRGLTLATMESCTGGLLADLLTNVPGSSEYFKGGLVTYSNEFKVTSGVSAELIARHGAVSAEVAEAMAEAARQRVNADVGVATTGVAGPDPLEGKPVGTVYTGVSDGVSKRVAHRLYPQGRLEIKRRAAFGALFELREFLLGES